MTTTFYSAFSARLLSCHIRYRIVLSQSFPKGFSNKSPKREAMMDAKPTPQNIQDAFLNTARRERMTITIYLMHGTKLTGRIKSFDKFSVLLESNNQDLLIFKHAISTMSYPKRGSGELRVTGDLRGVVDSQHSSGGSETKPLTPPSGLSGNSNS